MSWANLYTPPIKPTLTGSELYGPDPYDTNFVFPLDFSQLETERVKLVAFIPLIHAGIFFNEIQTSPDLLRYYPFSFPDLDGLLEYFELGVRRNPAHVVFSIIDKTKPDPEHPEQGGSFAGILGLYHASTSNLTAEIAFVAILPPFQRTHVASNAVGILMRYCLELPSSPLTPGLGLRRVQWCAHLKNTASQRLAERMGMKKEGVIRWHWVLPEALNRDGNKPGENDKLPNNYGRDTALLAACWDDWEAGTREIVQKAIERRV